MERESDSKLRRRQVRRRLIPYGLMAPGLIWLIFFFLIPMYFMAEMALRSGTLESGFQFTWEFSNFTDGIKRFDEQFIRSFVYATTATAIALLIAYSGSGPEGFETPDAGPSAPAESPEDLVPPPLVEARSRGRLTD